MRDWIGAGLFALALIVTAGPLFAARRMATRHHREQFVATGAAEFPLPPHSDVEREWHSAERATIPMRIVDSDTGETVRVGVDGLPLSEADLSARTPSTTLTVDPGRLAEILQLERTGEYPYSHDTWVEADAAARFMRDPLGCAFLPPIPLMDNASSPCFADTYFRLLAEGSLTTDWADEDSDFDIWYRELQTVNA